VPTNKLKEAFENHPIVIWGSLVVALLLAGVSLFLAGVNADEWNTRSLELKKIPASRLSELEKDRTELVTTQNALRSANLKLAEAKVKIAELENDANHQSDERIVSQQNYGEGTNTSKMLAPIQQQDGVNLKLRTATYIKFRKSKLVIHHSTKRRPDAESLAKSLSKYFDECSLIPCSNCDNAFTYPKTDQIEAATDFRASLIMLGYKEFENAVMESGEPKIYSANLN
jgi:hypothetical protein